MLFGNLFLDLLTALGCAIILGLIGIVLAFAWWVIKLIFQAGRDAQGKNGMSILEQYTYSLDDEPESK